MSLIITSLTKAHANLRALYDRAEDLDLIALLDGVTREGLRAGIIQNFEFTYELSWKLIKRWLETNLSKDDYDGISRRELYRHALENKLIENISNWFLYHENRNLTSHTYNHEVALKVYECIPEFIKDVQILIDNLKRKGSA